MDSSRERNQNVHVACCRLFEELNIRGNLNCPYAMPYANYIMSWSMYVPIHTIIIGQNPYPQKIYPEFGAAFSYDPQKSKSPPKTVHVLAHDIHNYDETDINLSIECFRDSWRLLEIGVILINETVFDKLLKTKNNIRGIKEMEAQTRALQILISESFFVGQEVITFIGMGIPAACMTSISRQWCPKDLIRMRVMTCKNPAARDIGDAGSQSITLGKPAVSKVLSQIVKQFSSMAPQTKTPAEKRRQQNADSLKKQADNVVVTGNFYSRELETFEERLRSVSNPSSDQANVTDVLSSLGPLAKAITNHTNAIASHTITMILVVESLPKETVDYGGMKPSDNKLSVPPTTPQRTGPRRRIAPKVAAEMESVAEVAETVPETIVNKPVITYIPSPTPSRSRRRTAPPRRASSEVGSEYTIDVQSNAGSEKEIKVTERTHIQSFANWCGQNIAHDPVFSEILNTAAEDLTIVNPLTTKVVDYIRERKSGDPEYDAYDELTDPNSATTKWAKLNIGSMKM